MTDKKFVFYLATGFKTGYSPLAPGTVGSVVALFPCWILSLFSLSFSAILLVVFIALAIWIAGIAERESGQKDPGFIVLDEFAGMMVTLLGIHFTWKTALAGLVLFRIMDIFKPFPIRYIERTVKGGAGIVLDDVAAGIAANLLLRLICLTSWMT